MQDVTLQEFLDQSARQLLDVTTSSVNAIQMITQQARMLAINALIEASNAGDRGAGFSAVASEVKGVADEIEKLATTLRKGLNQRVEELRGAVYTMTKESHLRRLTDLALNSIEIIDRNLYERTCDVRWWATETALVDCASALNDVSRARASDRLGVILSSYTVYLDIWLCDLQGRVIANGRPDQFDVSHLDVSDASWFKAARSLHSGTEYGVADIERCEPLDQSLVATYSAQVRRNGAADGEVIGILAIHFDWTPQAQTVVNRVRFDAEEAQRSRVLILDARQRVIAASDGLGILKERFDLRRGDRNSGAYFEPSGRAVGFHSTPGYESYRGLGWYGVVVQNAD